MPEPISTKRADDPLDYLRSAVASHAAATNASVQAGQQLQAEKREQPQPSSLEQPR